MQDPAGVTALLEKLRSSQAWADLQTAPSQHERVHTDHTPTPYSHSITGANQNRNVENPSSNVTISSEQSSSVAALLSQLRQSESLPAPLEPQEHTPSPVAHFSSSHESPSLEIATPVPKKRQDLRAFTFQQSLPHLASLSEDSKFVEALSNIRQEQTQIERQLWEERQAIHSSQESRVKVAVTKANMLGTGISEREASIMTQNFQRELHKFDKERVLPAWDGLIKKQQMTLEALGVPTMFATTVGSDRERQKRVVQVLEGITHHAEDEDLI